jgi:hypothetical protein
MAVFFSWVTANGDIVEHGGNGVGAEVGAAEPGEEVGSLKGAHRRGSCDENKSPF